MSYHSTKLPGRKRLFNMFFTFHRFAGGRTKRKNGKNVPAFVQIGLFGRFVPLHFTGRILYNRNGLFSRQAGGPQDRAQIERVKEN